MKKEKTPKQLNKENEELRIRLQEAKDILQAIREGAVDAVVVSGPKGEQVFTLTGEDVIYRRLVESMNEGGLTTTPEGRILFCNERFSKMLKMPMEEIIGYSIEKLIRQSDHKNLAALLISAQVKPSRKRLVFIAHDGTDVPTRVSAQLLQQEDSISICFVVMDMTELDASEEIIKQIREQKQALEESSAALRDSRRAALNIMEDALIARQRVEEINSELLHEIAKRKRAEKEIQKARDELEIRVKERTAELRRSRERLRMLAAELQLAEERERRRIAQDLHDSLGQILAFSGRELRILQKSLPDKAAKSLQAIMDQLNGAVEQTRTLSFDLSPSMLYDLGFEIAVEDLVERMSKERNIQCHFENCNLPKPLSEDVKILLYRSVRELLINAAKHANAGFVKVSLLRSSSEIYIEVEDDGQGFDPSILNDSPREAKRFGIFSIHERLSHIGGHLEIESAKGKGTRAVLIAPLDIEKED